MGSVFDNPGRLEWSQRGPWFSLSLRERVGVRGAGLGKCRQREFCNWLSDFGFPSGFGFREPIAKVAPRWYSPALFPLTPALREREHHRQRIRQPKPLGMVATRTLVLPLPEGEGRGEGEQRANWNKGVGKLIGILPAILLFIAGCSVGPDYHQPATLKTETLPTAFSIGRSNP